MLRLLPLLLLGSWLLPAGAQADDKKPAPPKRIRAPQAATEVIAALKAGDEKALQALAARAAPDPWLVADDLCARGEHDAAQRFADATSVKGTQKLAAYVAKMRDHEGHARARKLLTAVTAPYIKRDYAGVVKLADDAAEPTDTVGGILVAFLRAYALTSLRKRIASGRAMLDVASAAHKLGWLTRASDAYGRTGSAYFMAGRYEPASDAWRRLLAVAKTLGDTSAQARAHGDLAAAASSMGRPREALAAFEQALRIRKARGERRHVAWLYDNMSVVRKKLGESEAALALLTQALAIYRELKDAAGVGKVLANTGVLESSMGRLPSALGHLTESLEIMRSLKDENGVVIALGNIGRIKWRLGRAKEAIADYESALALARKLRHWPQVADQLTALGNARRAQGAYDRALAHYREALALRQKSGARQLVADTRGSMSLLALAQGKYVLALKHAEEAVDILRALELPVALAGAALALGTVHWRLGNLTEARALFEEAAALSEDASHPAGVASAQSNLGLVALDEGDLNAAAAAYTVALATHRKLGVLTHTAATLGNLAGVELQRRNLDAAAATYEEALALYESMGHTDSLALQLGNLALVRDAQGKTKEAVANLERARRLLADSPRHNTQARLDATLAEIRLRLGDADGATDVALAGLQHATALSQGLAEGEGASSRDQLRQAFDVAYRAAFAAQRPADLVAALELGRATSLREVLGAREALEAAVIPEELRAALLTARRNEQRALADLEKARRSRGSRAFATMRKARASWQTAQDEVVRVAKRVEREAKHAAAITMPAPDGMDRIQARLQPDEALVYYALTTRNALAVVLTRNAARIIDLGPTRKIRAATAKLLTGEHRVDAGAAPALAALIINPLELPKAATRVIISPMGRLGYVPFQLLLPKRVISHLPSGTTHGLLQDLVQPGGQGVLALGDPDYGAKQSRPTGVRAGGRAKLPALPATREEVTKVGSTTLLGSAASEAGLRAALAKRAGTPWRAVHFACHGLIDAERPMLSSLALSPDAENDGFLTAMELFRTQIPCDLVVLSACETARGRIYQTEGVVGLTRAFMFAGTPRVICSLWKVDDEATQTLMIKFYDLWNPKDGKPGIDAATALHQAQAHVRGHEKWKHPYYWAAWVLWGLGT